MHRQICRVNDFTMNYIVRKRLLYLSLALNLVLSAGFVINRFRLRSHSNPNASYLDNHQFKEQTAIFDAYTADCEIAIIGDSHVYKAHWDELLNTHVCNRGIGSDIIKGMYMRIQSVTHRRPRICFILGGANDIESANYNIDSSMYYLKAMTDSLTANNIKPVILELMQVGDQYPNHDIVNERAHALNARFKTLGYPTLHVELSNTDLQEDQIHLTASGYNKWKIVLENYLSDLAVRR